MAEEADGDDAGHPSLSARECEVLGFVARGARDDEIARALHISVHTVHSHLDRIRDKTGRRRRADLTRLAFEQGIVVDDA
jgi:DNA-binding CsgD family transcriptional regulator